MTPYSIRDIAERVDISPREVLDALLKLGGIRLFHEGHRIADPAAYVRQDHHFDPCPDLEFNLDRTDECRLAAELGVDRADIVRLISV